VCDRQSLEFERKEHNMHAPTEVIGNVYFCDFESAEREPARPAPVRPAAADLKLLMAQINVATKEIVAVHAEITRQTREQSRDLLAMVDVIEGIALRAGITARESPRLGANELREFAQSTAAASNELLALAREELTHARNAARRFAELGHRSGLIEHTVA
jgi:hypothetical protein